MSTPRPRTSRKVSSGSSGDEIQSRRGVALPLIATSREVSSGPKAEVGQVTRLHRQRALLKLRWYSDPESVVLRLIRSRSAGFSPLRTRLILPSVPDRQCFGGRNLILMNYGDCDLDNFSFLARSAASLR